MHPMSSCMLYPSYTGMASYSFYNILFAEMISPEIVTHNHTLAEFK